jgi:hypothetical protein
VGFGGECGNSRAVRADGAVVWAWNRRSEQLACMECDLAAHGLGNGGCCDVDEPAGALFDAIARDDRHEYVDRSLRETDRGSSRAAPGAPPPLETRQSPDSCVYHHASKSQSPFVGKSVGGQRDARIAGKRPAQAPESPYFPRLEAELGVMRENGPRQPPPRGFFVYKVDASRRAEKCHE